MAIDRLDRIAANARSHVAANRTLLDRLLDSRKDLLAVRPEGGTIVFPALLRGDAEGFLALLREKYETTVAPGRFFEMPEHFRMGIGGAREMVAQALERIAAALDDLAADA
jgi:hypothetical protein